MSQVVKYYNKFDRDGDVSKAYNRDGLSTETNNNAAF